MIGIEIVDNTRRTIGASGSDKMATESARNSGSNFIIWRLYGIIIEILEMHLEIMVWI